MNLKKALLGIALAGVVFGANAVTATTTTTTYTNNFNTWNDGYLTLANGASSTIFNITTAGVSSVNLDFWFSAPSTGGGTVSFASLAGASLFNTTGTSNPVDSWVLFGLNNPGSSSGNPIKNADSHFTTTLTGLSAGSYALTFAAEKGAFKSIKVDDVALTVTSAVPEPESYAMFLAGLGIMGAVVRRRQRQA